MDALKPIETSYNGYRFRSRLEARWAVHFEMHGVAYEYEKEGFELGKFGRYLPDFWLPEPAIWVEIKGQEPPPESDWHKMTSLVCLSGRPLICLSGGIGPECQGRFFAPTGTPDEYGLGRMTWVFCPGCQSLAALVWADSPPTAAGLWCTYGECFTKRRFSFNQKQLAMFLEESIDSVRRSYEYARSKRFEYGEGG